MNSTGFQYAGTFGEWETKDIVGSIFFTVLAVLTLFSNLFVLLVLHRGGHRFEEVMRFLIQALAVADLVGGVTCSTLQVLNYVFKRFPFSIKVCMNIPITTVYMVIKSLFIMCLINLYRCISVTYPLTHLRYWNLKRIRVLFYIGKCGVICFVVPLLPVKRLAFGKLIYNACDRSLTDPWRSLVDSPGFMRNLSATFAVTITAFLIPLIILTATNTKLLITAFKARRRLANRKKQQNSSQIFTTSSSATGISQRSQQGDALNGNKNNASNVCRFRRVTIGFKGFKTVLVVTGMFYVSCTPFCGVLVYTLTNHHANLGSAVVVTAHAFLLSNAWWNALIFFFTSKTFREEAIKLKHSLRDWF